MNSINRPRRRPRVSSVNFRSFYWLVRREAAWLVLVSPFDGHPWTAKRARFARVRADHLYHAVLRVIRNEPHRGSVK